MNRLFPLATCFLATMLCTATWAGDQQSDSKNKHAGDSSKQGRGDYELTPTGWVQMAVDYDNDGMFDAIETIYAYDFEKARKSSQERANRDADTMSRQQKNLSSNPHQESNKGGNKQSLESVSGKLLQLRDEQILGMNEPSVVARIRNQKNMPAKAVLGPKSQVDSWKLAEGDQISVKGQRGRVNDRPMLLASEVSWGDQTKKVDLPSSRNAKRVKVEVLSVRTTEFKGHDGKFVVAQVRSQSGKECEVNMGAKSKVDQLDLSKGDKVRMIVRPAKMNGRAGMVADQIMANGKTIEVSPPKQVAKKERNRSSQNRMAAGRSKAGQDDRSQNDHDSNESGHAALGIAVGETDEGVVIIGIHPESPLVDADIRIGDAIESINDKQVESPRDLISMIGTMKPGKSITIVSNREGESNEMNVTLTSRQKLIQSYR